MKKELSDQMLDDNFEPHGNKDNAAEKLGCVPLYLSPKMLPTFTPTTLQTNVVRQ